MSEPALAASPLMSGACVVPALVTVDRPQPVWVGPTFSNADATGLKRLKIAFVAAEALDIHSTLSALGTDSHEGNAVMRPITGSTAAFLAVKAAATFVTLKAADHLAKRNKKGAAWLLGASSVALSVIAVRNYRIQ